MVPEASATSFLKSGGSSALPISPAATSSKGEVEYLPLSAAAKLLPGRRAGRRISIQTVWRWCTKGVRNGIRLRSVMIGGQRCTTREWIEEFIEAVSSATQPGEDVPNVRTPRQRRTASEQAAEELKAAWRKRKT